MVIFYLAAAFKLWMLVDAMRRRVDNYWYFIIAFIPLGDWAYFIVNKFPELRKRLGGLRFYRPNSLEALTYAVKTTPSAENRLRLAEGLYDAGLRTEAFEHFEAVLKTYPGDFRALYGAAMTLKALGRLEAALERFEQLLERNPAHDDYVSTLELADTLRQLSRNEEARAELERLVRQSPRVKHYLALAEHLVDMGCIDDARSFLEIALREYESAPDFIKRRERKFIGTVKSLKKQLDQ
ncbi:MAG: tetratricopeptide repeat protein [Polyangiaceae bacterium]